MTDVVIIGAGGLSREAYCVFRDDNQSTRRWNVLGFVDDNPSLRGTALCDLPVLGDFSWLERNASKNFKVICAVGHPLIRKQLVLRACALGSSFCSVVHPSACMSSWVEVEVGSVICAGNILTTQIKIGPHVYLNLACTVGHDCVVGKYCNINPGCHISGNVLLGDGVDVGTGAVIIQNKSVGEWSIIGAGAVVTTDIPRSVTAVGVPCRVIKTHRPELSLASD
jgi:sugar O-acyltransferase (sialic acid O-acetyltransferase NeuD family)